MADAFFTRAPSTIVTMAINGQTEFTIPFEFLARKFVVVTLLGVDRKVLTINTDYRFIAVNKIRLEQPAPAGYPRIELRRVTSTTDRLVTFIDGSILRATDLNLAQVQTMHVAEEARDLTSDTIGVNDEGHLDARNRKIVNLANATDPLDAVNLGQLRQFDASTASNADKAQAAATAAKVSETNAKNSENRSVVAEANAVSSAEAAMTAASDANNSKLVAKQSADTVVPLVPIVEQNAAAAAKSAQDAAQAVQDVKDLGAVPVGSILMFGALPLPRGFISLMDENPTFNVAEFPDLAILYPTGKLPSYKDRVPEGIGSGIALSQKRAGSVGQTDVIQLATNVVDISHDHDFSGNTTYGGAHEHFINSLNQRSDSGVYPTIEYSNWRSPNPPNWTKTAIGGAHSHSFSGRTSGMRGGINQTHNHTISGTIGSGRNLVDATGTIFAIKAYGSIANEGSLDAAALSQSIQLVNSRVGTLENSVGFGRKVPVGTLLAPAAGWAFGDAECNVQETSSGYIVRIIFRANSGTTQRGMCYLAAGLKYTGYTSATVSVNGVLYPGYVEVMQPNILAVAGGPAGAFSWVMATLTLEKV